MRIILLATDESPQLEPLNEAMPGPLVPVVNRPLIGIMLELLARAGCKHAFVSTCNRAGSIAAYLNTGSRWGMTLDYVPQREQLGTAGSLRWAGHLLNETFLVLPANIVLDLDIEAALAFHRSHSGPATIIASRRHAQGSVALEVEQDRVYAVDSVVKDGSALCTTGAYIFEADVLSFIPPQTVSDCAAQLVPALIHASQDVRVFEMSGYYNPMETFQEYCEAQRVFLMNAYHTNQPEALEALGLPRLRYPSVEGRQIAPGIWVGLNDVIHPSVQLAAPVCVGDNCWIGRDAEIGPEVVIGANVVIDEGATVEASTVMDRTYVGQLLKLSHVVARMSKLIDTRTSQSTEVVDSFLLAEIGAEAPSGFFRRLFNLLGGLGLFVLALPLLLVFAVVALFNSGRIFQVERRIGSRPPTFRRPQETGPYSFDMLRFATGRAEGKPRSAHWLLRTGFAYWPALLNVVRGDCELVGVKPLLPLEVPRIQESWQQKHYDRPAGLTGAWYTQAPDDADLDQVLVIDAYYVSTRNWYSDMLLLWQTCTTWLRKRLKPHTNLRESTLASDIS